MPPARSYFAPRLIRSPKWIYDGYADFKLRREEGWVE